MGTQEQWKSMAPAGLNAVVTVGTPLREFSSGNFSENEFLRIDAGAANWGLP